MNKKGIILSVYVYVLLVFFLLILGSLLVVLNNTRILSDKIKEGAKEKADNNQYGFTLEISGLKDMCLNYGQEFQDPGFSAKDKDGNTLDVTVTSDLDIWKAGSYAVTYTARYNNKEKALTRNVSVIKNDYAYTGGSQTFTAPCNGIYKVELWGAQGGDSGTYIGGKGGYTTGNLTMKKDGNLYIYVGGDPSVSTNYNGGGNGGSYGNKGGGATDVRLTSGAWDNSNSLRSRIMVAGAGGGAGSRGSGYGDGNGGAAGGLGGSTGIVVNSTQAYGSYPGYGGAQTHGGTIFFYNNVSGGVATSDMYGKFGSGGGTIYVGGGSGYYGGGGDAHGGGGGGSSFISGYPGCNAIDAGGNPTDQSIHYSGIVFSNPVIKSGEELFINPTGDVETGHSGNGYARITYLGSDEDINDNNYVLKKFVAIGNNSGIKLRIQKSDVATSVMVRRKTSPWTAADTINTGTLISNNITITNPDNTWYSDTAAVNGNRYYYKAFALINGAYKYIPFEDEASAVGGGLVAEYAFEGNGNDTSGTANNINEGNAVTYSTGAVGTTAVFNGTSSYFSTPVYLDSGTYSISLWTYTSGTSAGEVVLIGTCEGGGYYLLQTPNEYNLSFGVVFNGYRYTTISNAANTWKHIVFVVNTTSKMVKIYINGALEYQNQYWDAYGPSQLVDPYKRTCISCNPDNATTERSFYNGKMDQIRMYNRELLPDEILSLYNE